MEGSQRPTIGYQVAVVILVALIVTALGLIVSMAVRPSANEALAETSTNQEPSRCHSDGDGNVCFNTLVRNVGDTASTFLCQVAATDASQATFPPAGSANTEVYLQPGNIVTV